MGGKSQSTQTQESKSAPWAAAQPALQGMLSQIQTGLGATSLSGAETEAINQLMRNAGGADEYAPQIQSYAQDLLNGGGAMGQAGRLDQNFADYQRRLSPIADGANTGPGGNPALQGYLDTIRDDVTNQVNGSFAAAGRDFSGANFGALGRGIASGMAPVLAQQYNTDVNHQRSAVDALYNSGNTQAGLLSGLNQQRLTNQGAGIGAAEQALGAQDRGANAALEAEAKRRGIPVQALGLLAEIGIPIAGLGSQSSGTATTTNKMSGAQQFAAIAGGIGSLFPKYPIKFGT